jgi:hypothetical protein
LFVKTVKIFLFVTAAFISATAFSATYYVCGSAATCNSGSSGWSSGSDSDNCTSKATPCATTAGVTGKMSSGDTAIFGNGSYGTPSCSLVHGSPANGYTTIKAEQIGGVTMGGIGCGFGSSAYIAFDGLFFTSGTLVESTDHVKFLRCGNAYVSNPITSNFAAGEGASYILFEQCYAYGNGRYKFLAWHANNIVMRQNVVRMDAEAAAGQQIAGLAMYSMSNGLMANNIVIDSDHDEAWSDQDERGCYYFPDTSASTLNIILDTNLCLNSKMGGINIDGNEGPYYSQVTANNNVVWKASSHSGTWTNYSRGDFDHWTNNTFGVDTSNALAYHSAYASSSGTAYNNLFYSLTPPATAYWSYLTHDYNYWYSTPGGGLPTLAAHEKTNVNPIWNASTNPSGGLKYITRIEAGSNLSGVGQGGANIGATLQYMIGVSGTLYGETGYNVVQSTPMWPFPNEAVIKTKMASYSNASPPLSGARGFAAPGTGLYGGPTTLTSYIWEYLGNPCPADICSTGGTTYTVTPSAGANGSISPNTSQTINSGDTTAFTVTPDSGYTANVGGTCGGSLVGTTYTTNAVTANCTVSATFADTTAPSTPTDLDARSNSQTSVDLSWVASTDAVGVTSYRVDYCSGYNCSSWATLGTSATNAYTHTGITPAANPTIYRYRVYALDAANNLSGAATSIYFNAVPTIPAFPGAEGSGATSKGGRGGTVYRVTSLDGGTGAGTLRACVATSGPRTCVFDVSGNIELTGNINISLPYITIAGHTAPGGGITISGKNSTQVSLTVRTHNVTIRGIRIRKGYNAGTPAQDGDSVNVLSASATASPVGPVIFDHVTASWGQDENAGAWALTTRAPKNITYQWVMMYEPLLAHPVNFMTGAYNNATAEQMTDIDVHHSLFANSSHRNPLIKNKTFRLVNNLIYNWGDWASAIEGTVQADLIGNRYKTGPLYQTISSKAYEIQLNPTGDASTPTLGSPSLYVIGNVGLHNTDPLADNWGMTRLIDIPINAGVELGPLSESYRRFTPLSALPFPITAQDVWTAETIVLAGAGASRRLDCSGNWVSNRDSADARVVAEYTAGNAGIIPANEDAVGGYPTLAAGTACTDGDGDGMPDTWETANGLNASSASDGPTLHASGYSNLEMYLAGSSSETTPVLSNLLPTSNLARTATSATLQATTDQTATCRYALGSGIPYAGMTLFSNTASTTHSSNVSVTAGGVYQYCVRCMGISLVSDESCTRFAVDPNSKKRVRH